MRTLRMAPEDAVPRCIAWIPASAGMTILLGGLVCSLRATVLVKLGVLCVLVVKLLSSSRATDILRTGVRFRGNDRHPREGLC